MSLANGVLKQVTHDIVKNGVMLSLSKHCVVGLCARVFDKLRLTIPLHLFSFHLQSPRI
jgi:hypothetical protein